MRSLGELTHPDDRGPRSREGMQRLVDGEIPTFRTEFRMLGAGRPSAGSTSPPRPSDGADGVPLYRISQLYDIDVRTPRPRSSCATSPTTTR